MHQFRVCIWTSWCLHKALFCLGAPCWANRETFPASPLPVKLWYLTGWQIMALLFYSRNCQALSKGVIFFSNCIPIGSHIKLLLLLHRSENSLAPGQLFHLRQALDCAGSLNDISAEISGEAREHKGIHSIRLVQPAIKLTSEELSKPETILNEWVGKLQLTPFSSVTHCIDRDKWGEP